MEIVNCVKCGNVFDRIDGPICKECQKNEELIFQSVKDFLDTYPNSTLEETTIATGVSVKKIMKYLKDGRLETSKGMQGALSCVQCGKSIKRGRFCDACVISVNQNVIDMFATKRAGTGVGMHIKRGKDDKR